MKQLTIQKLSEIRLLIYLFPSIPHIAHLNLMRQSLSECRASAETVLVEKCSHEGGIQDYTHLFSNEVHAV
jgi:hypothetical protein